jgi:hypothetical protein
MLSTMANWLLGCSHRHTSFPITFRNRTRSRTPGIDTYVVCLDCGKHFPYDWAEMRIAKEPAVAAAPHRADHRSGMRSPFPAGNRLLHRLVHHS